jgi:hypothetical protein
VRLTGSLKSSGPRVGGIGFTDENIRANSYLLSRRLWLQDRIIQNGAPVNPSMTPSSIAAGCANTNSTALPAHSPDAGCSAGRDVAEGWMDSAGNIGGFFFWATSTGLESVACSGGRTGRQVMGPHLRAHGFLSCLPGDADPQECDGTTLCSICDGTGGVGYAPGVGAASALVVNTITNGTYNQPSCGAVNAVCWSDGSVCASATATCPVPPTRPAGWVCSQNSECSSGNCDPFGRVCL